MADIREIPRDQWIEFLDDFTREHQGWQVTVEVQDREAGSHVEAHDLPLQGISADNKGSERDVSIIVGDEVNPALTHIIPGASSMRVIQGGGGNPSKLEIESVDGSKTMVRFLQVPEAA